MGCNVLRSPGFGGGKAHRFPGRVQFGWCFRWESNGSCLRGKSLVTGNRSGKGERGMDLCCRAPCGVSPCGWKWPGRGEGNGWWAIEGIQSAMRLKTESRCQLSRGRSMFLLGVVFSARDQGRIRHGADKESGRQVRSRKRRVRGGGAASSWR